MATAPRCLGHMLTVEDPPLAAAWALAWTGAARLPATPPALEVFRALFQLWRESDSSEVRRFAAWAFSEQPLLSRDAFAHDTWGDCDAWLEQCASGSPKQVAAALVVAWYRRRPWSDAELATKVQEKKVLWSGPTADELLDALGEPTIPNKRLHMRTDNCAIHRCNPDQTLRPFASPRTRRQIYDRRLFCNAVL